jgi:hypothetical protein
MEHELDEIVQAVLVLDDQEGIVLRFSEEDRKGPVQCLDSFFSSHALIVAQARDTFMSRPGESPSLPATARARVERGRHQDDRDNPEKDRDHE